MNHTREDAERALFFYKEIDRLKNILENLPDAGANLELTINGLGLNHGGDCFSIWFAQPIFTRLLEKEIGLMNAQLTSNNFEAVKKEQEKVDAKS